MTDQAQIRPSGGSSSRAGNLGARRRSRVPDGRGRVVKVKATEDERDRWKAEAAACGLSFGAWAARTLDAAVRRRAGPSELRDTRETLRALERGRVALDRVGSNVNQIARRYNAGDPVLVEELRAALQAVSNAALHFEFVGDDAQAEIKARRNRHRSS